MPVGRWVILTAESVVLTDRTSRPVDIDLQVTRVDVDIDFLGFGQHGNGSRRRVDPALGLGDWYPLHPMRTTLMLKALPGVLAFHHERDLVQAIALGWTGRQDLDLPPFGRRVSGIHVIQVLGEEVGLLATLGPSDLKDHVPADIGITGDEEQAELLFEPDDVLVGLGQLGLGQLALGTGGVGDHVAGGLDVGVAGLKPTEAADDLLEFTVASRNVAQPLGVRGQIRIVELSQNRLVLMLQVDQAFPQSVVEHGRRVAPPAQCTGRGIGSSALGCIRTAKVPDSIGFSSRWARPASSSGRSLRSDAGSAPHGRRSRRASACLCKRGGIRCTTQG